MKIVLSTEELKNAVAEYVAKTHPVLAGKSAHITFEKRPLTQTEWAAANNGLRVDLPDWVQAVIDCPGA